MSPGGTPVLCRALPTLAEDQTVVGAHISQLPECLGRQARASESWVLYSDGACCCL